MSHQLCQLLTSVISGALVIWAIWEYLPPSNLGQNIVLYVVPTVCAGILVAAICGEPEKK
jgi:hypothetical protein